MIERKDQHDMHVWEWYVHRLKDTYNHCSTCCKPYDVCSCEPMVIIAERVIA